MKITVLKGSEKRAAQDFCPWMINLPAEGKK